MVNLVRRLKAAGVPIDGIGVQAHLIVGSVPGSFATNLAQFAALGVDVAITELDIRLTLPASASSLQRQADDYRTITNACLSVPRCVGITIWDLTDVSVPPVCRCVWVCVGVLTDGVEILVGAERVQWPGRCAAVGSEPCEEAGVCVDCCGACLSGDVAVAVYEDGRRRINVSTYEYHGVYSMLYALLLCYIGL